ncbi:MAG: aminopeptidase [Bacteroidales bacterium]
MNFLVAPLLFILIGPANGSYFLQAVSGHFRIMCSREPIEKILETNQPDIETQNKFKLVLKVREYATKELGLPENKSYTLFSEINGKYLGWNVYCAPKFSVESKKWCFPIAGCVVYRGYFSKKKALVFANKMEEKGFDVFVGPFNAYSTLGWYDDPLLSSHLLLDSIHLAGIIIHELAHQKIYVSGDSRFDEGYAVTVERAGVLRWLKSIGRDDQIVQALKIWDEEDISVAKILNSRSQLNAIYLSGLDSKSLSQKKDSIFQDLKKDLCSADSAGINLPKTDGEDFELNNAYLVPVNVYYSLVPFFHTLLDSCGGNFLQFFEKVEELGKLPFEERQRKLEPDFKTQREF